VLHRPIETTAFIGHYGATLRYLSVAETHLANSLVKNGTANDDADMLLPAWVLFTISTSLGVLGLVMAYKHNWAAIVPVLAVLTTAAATIVQLRDPLSLAPQFQPATRNWDYIVMLMLSVVVGLTLPIVGSYLGGRRKR
jgi:hypothetical protein